MPRPLSQPFVSAADPHEDHTLILTFVNGEKRLFDLKPYLATEVFGPLKDPELFRQVRVVHGSLEWPGERDLAYDMLYATSVPVAPHEAETRAAP